MPDANNDDKDKSTSTNPLGWVALGLVIIVVGTYVVFIGSRMLPVILHH